MEHTYSIEEDLNNLTYANIEKITQGKIPEPEKSQWKWILSQPINFNYVPESKVFSLLGALCNYLHEDNVDLWEIICSHQLDFNLPSQLDAHTP